MAVVFISPQQRQKTFILIVVFVVFLLIVLFATLIFLSKPPKISSTLFNKNDAMLNLSILDSKQFQSLEMFPRVPSQFSYNGLDKDKKAVRGVISAESAKVAESMLMSQGMTLLTIQETNTQGRDNPFMPVQPIVNSNK